MKTIVLVACSKSKLDKPAQARDLYTSDLFRKSREYAEAVGDEWFILSAKHGLVKPDQVLEPYDESLNDVSSRGKRMWGWRAAMLLIGSTAHGDRIIFLAGKNYIDPILYVPVKTGNRHLGRIREAFRWRGLSFPLDGRGIGQRLAWLKRENARRSAA